MKKKLILSLVVVVAIIGLAGCGVQVNPENALTPEVASGFWQTFMILPLIWLITWFYNVIGSLGVAIIIVTILTKLVVMPLMLKSMNSSAKMQTIQPEIQKIQKKYAGKSDRESQMKMNAEVQRMYKESGVNPLAGCLPILIQTPLMFAFFQAFLRHPLIASTEVRYFLGMNLSAVQEIPNIVFAVLVAGLMYFSQVMMQKRTQNNHANNQSPVNPQMMNLIFLPVMGLTVYGSPLAMGLYFLVGQIMAVIQSFIIKKPGVTPF